MLRFVTTADTEILAATTAAERLPDGFAEVRCANPAMAADPAAFVEEVLDGARVVVCRILGGRRGWQDGFDPCARGVNAGASHSWRLAGNASRMPR